MGLRGPDPPDPLTPGGFGALEAAPVALAVVVRAIPGGLDVRKASSTALEPDGT